MSYGWHEVLDRTALVEDIFDVHIQEHPVLENEPELSAQANEIAELLGKFYQAVAQKCPHMNPKLDAKEAA